VTGWRCNNSDEILEAIKIVSSTNGPAILEKFGNAARERARQEFVPENWIKHILEDL